MAKGDHLEATYATTLARMKTQKGGRSRLGMEALMWVSNSERPLHTSELCHALGVKIGSPDLNVENIPSIKTLLASSLGLITVEASSSTARLVHFSLQEYISDNPGLFQGPHSMIADVCLTYLNFKCVQGLSPIVDSAPSMVPLVGYASIYWGKHIRREKAAAANPLALKLLLESERHISSQLLLLDYNEKRGLWESDFDVTRGPNGFTGLHGAAFFGIVEIFAALLGMKGWDINAADITGKTAFLWAARGGHEGVIKLLLEQEHVDPNTADHDGWTPLISAAERGHEEIVKLLLEREDVSPNTADSLGDTPLASAVQRGHEGIVKLLLEREDIDPNAADSLGDTPLVWAVQRGHEGIVKLLLEREDINPNIADEVGDTPLILAAEGGYEGIVRLLLEREDINPNIADEVGDTLLVSAV